MQSDQGNNNIHYRISIKYPYTSCCTIKKIQYKYSQQKDSNVHELKISSNCYNYSNLFP